MNTPSDTQGLSGRELVEQVFGPRREWKPSKRASQAISAMWEAFYAGDRWLRCEQASTARYTVVSLQENSWADVDPDNDRRFRISEYELNRNGLTRMIPMFAGATLNQITDIQEAIELAEDAS